MNRAITILYIVVIIIFLESCNRNQIIHVNDGSIEIAIVRKNHSTFVVFEPSEEFNGNLVGSNFIELEVKGGIVPDNFLNVYKEIETNTVVWGYSGEVLYQHLDSTFVFYENEIEVCYDRISMRHLECSSFDLFYYIYGD